MIVFWQEYWRGSYGEQSVDWRVYKGRTKFRNGQLHTYPTNGTRKKLSQFIAFDERTTPPTIFTNVSNTPLAQGVDRLVRTGAISEHLPATYIDLHGNIRRTDATLSLVLMGPDWSAVKEDEFQEVLAVPF